MEILTKQLDKNNKILYNQRMEKYLRPKQLKKEFLFFASMTKWWYLKQIESGRLKALNTSSNPAEPRYVVARSEAKRFINDLRDGKNILNIHKKKGQK